MYDLEIIYTTLKENLSEKRYQHCLNVADMAKNLAKIYNVDEEKAYVGGLLHDIAKEMSYEEYLRIEGDVKFYPEEFSKENYKIFHGWAASAYAKKYLGIFDEEILNAIKYHTTGRKNMTLLDKIIFAADCISIERSFENIEYFRSIAKVNMDIVIVDKLINALKKCLHNKDFILKNTYEAYNEIILKNKSFDNRKGR